ncbi:hypothetical protein [Oceanobacillus halotolerans]|uniref:hypothetical protein n=1 Tax=Oceanobacillus halotolerans TaxID=2663380 RepID=UPI0013DA7A09|nr:hypothetical protein [Oceanobacillus halotolerans]
MKTWNQLLIRHGWLLTEGETTIFDYKNETETNIDFLLEGLDRVNIDYVCDQGTLILPSATFSEEKWIEAVDVKHRGRGGDFWFEWERRDCASFYGEQLKRLRKEPFKSIVILQKYKITKTIKRYN